MKISVVRVITRLNVGGPARQALLLNQQLPKLGFRSELVFGSESAHEGRLHPPEGTKWTKIATLRRRLDPIADVRALRALSRILRDRRPLIVHTHTAKAGLLGRLSAHRTGVPLTVHTYHGHVLDGYFSRAMTRVFTEIERRLARRTTALIAVSEEIRNELLSFGIGAPEQWHVLPDFTDVDHLLSSQLSRADARARLGLVGDGPMIGIVGRLVPIKDHTTFLQAAALIARHRPNTRFIVAGDGELRQQIERDARRLLGDRVDFLGWIDDLEALYRALDVVVLSSRNEGTPLALIEAGAAARPVVATRVGGVGAVVRDGESGLLVNPGDAEALSRAIETALVDETARRFGACGRAIVSETFSSGRLVREVAEIYGDLLASLRNG